MYILNRLISTLSVLRDQLFLMTFLCLVAPSWATSLEEKHFSLWLI